MLGFFFFFFTFLVFGKPWKYTHISRNRMRNRQRQIGRKQQSRQKGSIYWLSPTCLQRPPNARTQELNPSLPCQGPNYLRYYLGIPEWHWQETGIGSRNRTKTQEPRQEMWAPQQEDESLGQKLVLLKIVPKTFTDRKDDWIKCRGAQKNFLVHNDQIIVRKYLY